MSKSKEMTISYIIRRMEQFLIVDYINDKIKNKQIIFYGIEINNYLVGYNSQLLKWASRMYNSIDRTDIYLYDNNMECIKENEIRRYMVD